MFWTKPPAIFGQVFQSAWWQLPSADREVYLTFDDGPHTELTPFILNELGRHGFKATFFCLGMNAERHPDLMDAIRAAGHAVGNHSYSHLNGWQSPAADYLADVARADAVIGSRLFRPPYGKLSWSQWQALKAQYQVVMWSNMPEDFRTDLDAEVILHRLTDRVNAGDIVVLHENDKSLMHLKAILPEYLRKMKEAGYTLKALPHAD